MNQQQLIDNFRLFVFEDKQITTYVFNNEVWFKGKELAAILEYKDTVKAIRQHVDAEDKLTLTELLSQGAVANTLPFSDNIQGQTIMINESGFYCMVLKSRMEKAVSFRKWVTKIVLPSIRKTGQFIYEETKKENERLHRLVEWFQEHSAHVPDPSFQILPPKKMKYIPAKKEDLLRITLEEPVKIEEVIE